MAGGILYLQFTNPAGYPPLAQSARTLAERGWSVTFLAAGAYGAAAGLRLPAHPNIRVKEMPYIGSRALRKAAYLAYCAWAVSHALIHRPRWIYASDPLSCLPALLASIGSASRVVYHEHDSPPSDGGAAHRSLLRHRVRLARRARLCVLPNAQRAAKFASDTGTRSPVICVWNCPAKAEVKARPSARPRTTLFYHGSLNPERLPYSILEAMAALPARVRLDFAGYATSGSADYPQEFLAEAARLGLRDRVAFLGARNRSDLLELCRQATIGISLMPKESSDPNMAAMAGASNKAFDYMACGLALLVTDLPEWEATFVEPGYGLACDPRDVQSIARAIARLDERPDEAAMMGERGARRIWEEWNYDAQFAPVLAELERL